jgi:hypothetical protein
MVELLPVLDPPQAFLIPEDLMQKLSPIVQDIIIRRDDEDVTDVMEKWMENALETDRLPELRSKLDRVKLGERISDGSFIALSQLQQPCGIGAALVKEITAFVAPFVVKKFESLGRGVVFLQSESELFQWKISKSADETLNRQWVVTYCSQKSVKKSTKPIFDVEDREHILKIVSEYNPKTHMIVLLQSGSHCASLLVPLYPSFEVCKKCGAISRFRTQVLF